MRSRRFLAAALVAVAIHALPATPASADPDGPPLVVRFRSGVDEATELRSLAAGGYELVDRMPGSDFALVRRTRAATSPTKAAVAIAEAGPVVTMEAFAVPNDPFYPYQWNLPAVQASTAWDTSTGTGAVVAVIDTGVAYEEYGTFHRASDLAGTSFTAGWDFVDND